MLFAHLPLPVSERQYLPVRPGLLVNQGLSVSVLRVAFDFDGPFPTGCSGDLGVRNSREQA